LIIAAAGILMQSARGAVYAWSVFRSPLTNTYGWTISQVTFAFELAILHSASHHSQAVFMDAKTGPWPMPMLAAALYGGGIALAGLSHDLVLPYLAYGVIGGAGLRLAYIVSWLS
jgi:MFS transporter, OFA family, oxalate/formate antiporter